ncbi:cell wall-binding repeat-containing protein [Herbiconiux sp. CPCC 203407]|uniref:Cell wall-binding repeat-containing protein n=1 Tax=Herbiconiux oxytropis TaxID=2970915 RepID=A0AA41XGS8_9MICO|nr:cell wall-binding repeat-containing protein [Herbiconiux oxytropis]MCS5722797.1 cell wall-binding repeat-containing protein [Herbiconiux oxytropis]MCS5727727.1 cell wall-binding repeat-containing protein [Herbiconiux oxytropis]
MHLRSFHHGAIAAAVLTVAALLPATSASATPTLDAPVCPQAEALQGLAIAPTPALAEPDYNAVVEISAGALPAGVLLEGDRATNTPYVFRGTPSVTGSFTFTVKRIFEDATPLTTSCTMTVGTPGDVSRIEGLDRYDQAVTVSKASFASSDIVYVASGEKYSDALSAASVAGLRKAPLLLSRSTTITTSTSAELLRLNPKHVVIVGGTASVAEIVVDALKAVVPEGVKFTRIGGADRFEVSRALIRHADLGVSSASGVVVATGSNFSDALAASPAAVLAQAPVLLVNGSASALTAEEAALLAHLGARSVHIAGGPASVSPALETFLAKSFTVTRSNGTDRYEAAVALNKAAFTSPTGKIYLASGTAFADALSAGPVAGRDGSPIYLVKNGCVPNSVLQEIVRLKPTSIIVLGGTATLSASVEALKSC